MRKIFEAIETVGPTDATVLITGESGTGKELVAAPSITPAPQISPLVAIHCGALTRPSRSELFGHEKAPSPARSTARKANSKLPRAERFPRRNRRHQPQDQTDLLRTPGARNHPRRRQPDHQVDFRCIAHQQRSRKTHRGRQVPSDFSTASMFSASNCPAARAPDDIPVLVNHFVQKFSQAMNKRVNRVAPAP